MSIILPKLSATFVQFLLCHNPFFLLDVQYRFARKGLLREKINAQMVARVFFIESTQNAQEIYV